MTELSDEDKRILGYLKDRAAAGHEYFRSRHIAEAVDLSAKQVGARLGRIAAASDELEIEQWGRSKSTTWRVTPTS